MSERQAAPRHLNLPLDEDLYQRLRAEAERTGRPATRIAREAIELFLEEARRAAVHEAIASYAAAAAGTSDDLDPELEEAAVEFLRDGAAESGDVPAAIREKPQVRTPRQTKRRAAGKRRTGSR